MGVVLRREGADGRHVRRHRDVAEELGIDRDVGGPAAVDPVAIEEVVSGVEEEVTVGEELIAQLGGAAARRHFEPPAVHGQLAPVAHQAAGAALFGVVHEHDQVAARFVGAEQSWSDARCGAGPPGDLHHVAGTFTCGCEAFLERTHQPRRVGVVEHLGEVDDGLFEIGQRGCEDLERADVDHTVDDPQLLQIDHRQGAGSSLRCVGGAQQQVGSPGPVLRHERHEPAGLGERTTEVVAARAESVGGLRQCELCSCEVAALHALQPEQHRPVPVGGRGARSEPADADADRRDECCEEHAGERPVDACADVPPASHQSGDDDQPTDRGGDQR